MGSLRAGSAHRLATRRLPLCPLGRRASRLGGKSGSVPFEPLELPLPPRDARSAKARLRLERRPGLGLREEREESLLSVVDVESLLAPPQPRSIATIRSPVLPRRPPPLDLRPLLQRVEVALRSAAALSSSLEWLDEHWRLPCAALPPCGFAPPPPKRTLRGLHVKREATRERPEEAVPALDCWLSCGCSAGCCHAPSYPEERRASLGAISLALATASSLVARAVRGCEDPREDPREEPRTEEPRTEPGCESVSVDQGWPRAEHDLEEESLRERQSPRPVARETREELRRLMPAGMSGPFREEEAAVRCEEESSDSLRDGASLREEERSEAEEEWLCRPAVRPSLARSTAREARRLTGESEPLRLSGLGSIQVESR